MCLIKLEDFNVRLNKNGVGTGYKVFRKFEERLYGEYARAKKERRIGVWLKEKNFRPIRTDDGLERIGKMFRPKYKPGWHIFLRNQDAVKWSTESEDVRRIKFKGIVTMGRSSNDSKIIVAKEIFIPRERKHV